MVINKVAFLQKLKLCFILNILMNFFQLTVKKQNRQETVQLNHLSLKLPSFPLLSQPELIKPGTLCNSSTISSSCEKKYCDCTHVLEVKHNSVIELVFISDGNIENRLIIIFQRKFFYSINFRYCHTFETSYALAWTFFPCYICR